MRFSSSAVLALVAIIHSSDAFLPPSLKTTDIIRHKNILDALSSTSEDEANEDGSQGSSRFQEMLRLAKQEQENRSSSMQGTSRAIDNPFLNSPSASTQPSANPDDLSVEEQARMFREMMAGNQNSAIPAPPPSVVRTAMTDRAGRPVGRNPDADKIANTSDLYFAQLKRDSTVRTLGRMRGDGAVSEAVFEDDGIKELDGLLLSNPYLKGQKDEERALLENLPDEVVAPYFKNDEVEDDMKSSSGISYKQKLMERRQKKLDGGSTPAPKQGIAEMSQIEEPSPPTPPEVQSQPDAAFPQATTPPPSQPEAEQESIFPQESGTPPQSIQQQEHSPSIEPETPRQITVTSSNDVRTQNLRTLMGLVLKHRGGPGFGKGRLKGPDVDLFEGLVEEITNMLRDEANFAKTENDSADSAMEDVSPEVVEDPAPHQATTITSHPEKPVAVTSDSSDSSQSETQVADNTECVNIDSTIACIEGAITMYNNSPPAIQDSVLVTLRAALMSAVDTCNAALASPPTPSVPASPDSSVKGMVACIEGAITMYKNSPPTLKESVMVTLRMALMSAVETCNVILSTDQAAPTTAVPSQPVVQSVTPVDTANIPVLPQPPAPTTVEKVAPQPPAAATVANKVPQSSESATLDENSKALERIYEKVQSASGDGKLGLRSDLTADEASALADELVDMRKILMGELEAGIPESKPAIDSSQAWENAVNQESSASSRYQQMLAKARAEKAKAKS